METPEKKRELGLLETKGRNLVLKNHMACPKSQGKAEVSRGPGLRLLLPDSGTPAPVNSLPQGSGQPLGFQKLEVHSRPEATTGVSTSALGDLSVTFDLITSGPLRPSFEEIGQLNLAAWETLQMHSRSLDINRELHSR